MIKQDIYQRAFRIIGNKTPLKANCGLLCDCACCKGDENTGMVLFPEEETVLNVKTKDGVRLAVCDGTCDRATRPLACRIFPFFPAIDEKGKISVVLDARGAHICPMILHADEIVFDKSFLRRIKRAGRLLSKDAEIRTFLKESTEEIEMHRRFFK